MARMLRYILGISLMDSILMINNTGMVLKRFKMEIIMKGNMQMINITALGNINGKTVKLMKECTKMENFMVRD